jgi:predicted small secreted protein
MEVDPLVDFMERNCRCPDCKAGMSATLHTLCLATSMTLSCTNDDCGYVDSMRPPIKANLNERNRIHREDGKERMSDYALNVLYVVGFLSCGDGGADAGRILALLGLPNNTTMEKRSFPIIEERIAPVIQLLTRDILLENLKEEVRKTVSSPNDFDIWLQSIDPTSGIVLDKENYPKLRVSFDMAWQQRNSGNRYASLSGHALFVGGFTRRPIGFVIKSKLCNFCSAWKKKAVDDAEEVPDHVCYKNHNGSSGAMEPIACLELTIEMYDVFHCAVTLICADDDSSTRALLKWSNADYMKNNNTTIQPMVPITRGPNKGSLHPRPDRGQLPSHIPEPSFVADPNHRKKVLTGELIALDKAKVSEKATMTRMDSTRLGKNFGYMIRTLKNLDVSEYCKAGAAVLEHHFDNHEHCGPWCRRKTMTTAQLESSTRYYRCKTADAKLYKILADKINRFTTLERLQEVAHGMDTQVNESFNNTASWFAPKNKVYCGSSSLTNRLSIALGINSLGLKEYFKRLFKRLGIRCSSNVLHSLQTRDRSRNYRLKTVKTTDKKKDRIKRKHLQLVEDEAVAVKERNKRTAVYQSGIYMADEDNDQPPGPAPQKRKKNNPKNLVCPRCGLQGHSTTRSRKCLHYTGPRHTQVLRNNDAEEEELDPADDTDIMDHQILRHDPNQIDTEEDIEAMNAFLTGRDSDANDVGIVRATL